MKIARRYTFSAAHHLTHVPKDHKCARPHGHTYVVWIIVEAPTHLLLDDKSPGWVMDFALLDQVMAPFVKDTSTDAAILDHQDLNEVAGLRRTTCEWLAMWLSWRVWPALPGHVTQITVRVGENEHSYAEHIYPEP